ncbi:ribonuclease HII [Aristophania vespae]|uniref:Ribonuclease HII n=1 Tax=Aristophania vespae TaxID=2697033 RepID=A0A6P1NC03_9PROT|nr:ribonuclease HII [Aristophania vespae]QHI95876.1 ribonuclease HII [Aristophania vespae]
MPDYSLEIAYKGLVAGVDEVGRGPLAGPVVAAAVAFITPPEGELAMLIDDSKKLSAIKREKVFKALYASKNVFIAPAAASVQEIEALNISNAAHLAMRRALKRLAQKAGQWPVMALIDGKHAPKNIPCPIKMIIKGDGLSLSIAAASIIAKVLRDRAMERLSHRYPMYSWERNSGYGTAAHLSGLKISGITPHHRRDFAPIRRLIPTEAFSL